MLTRILGLALLLSACGLCGYAADPPKASEPATREEQILAIGIKVGILSQVVAEVDEGLGTVTDEEVKKDWGKFKDEIKDEIKTISVGVSKKDFNLLLSLKSLARYEREVRGWQAASRVVRAKPRDQIPQPFSGIVPQGPVLNIVQYDAVQLEALKLLTNPAQTKALVESWMKASGLKIEPPRPGEGYGHSIQRAIMEDIERMKKGDPKK